MAGTLQDPWIPPNPHVDYGKTRRCLEASLGFSASLAVEILDRLSMIAGSTVSPAARSLALTASITLCDLRPEVVEAWKSQFEEHPEVEIVLGDIFETAGDVLVIPGNGFGFLDRGLELGLCERYGFELQDRLRDQVREQHFGELLVGESTRLEIETSSSSPASPGYGLLVYSTIYRTPRKLASTLNAYLAARGALSSIRDLDSDGSRALRVVIPGLGTGAAGLHPVVSARQLRYAWELHSGKRGFGDKNLTQLARRERKLRKIPRSVLELEAEAAPGPEGTSSP